MNPSTNDHWVLLRTSSVQCLIRLEMRKWNNNRIEEILVSNSSLASGLSEASGVKFSWVEVSQESQKMLRRKKKAYLRYD